MNVNDVLPPLIARRPVWVASLDETLLPVPAPKVPALAPELSTTEALKPAWVREPEVVATVTVMVTTVPGVTEVAELKMVVVVVESAEAPWQVVQPEVDTPVLPVLLAKAVGRDKLSASRAGNIGLQGPRGRRRSQG